VTFYGDYAKMCKDFAPNFSDKNWQRQRTVSNFLFTREFLTKNNITVVPHPPYFSLFPRLKIKLKGRNFYTNEVIEVESQAVPNTLREHDFQDAFKKWQKGWKWCIRAERDYFEGDNGRQGQS
jgi:hypothetical protein